jgi:hypothetical protein
MKYAALLALLFMNAAWASGLDDMRTAAQAEAPVQDSKTVAEVQVDGTRHPELKPYRVMSSGLDAFDEHRGLAPNATLRFRLRQRTVPIGEPQKWDGVTLRLAGDQLSISVPVAADGTFTRPAARPRTTKTQTWC